MEPVEGSLHQGCHDAAQAGLIVTAIALAIVLHAKPRGQGKVVMWILPCEYGPQTADTALTGPTSLSSLTMPLLLYSPPGDRPFPQTLNTSSQLLSMTKLGHQWPLTLPIIPVTQDYPGLWKHTAHG